MNTKTEKHLIRTTNPANWLDCYGAMSEYYGEHAIGGSFRHLNAEYIVVTPEQAESFARVVAHQGKENLLGVSLDGFCGDYYLALSFKHVMIGIEPDGYAHS